MNMPNTLADNLVNLVKDHLLRSWTTRQVFLSIAHVLRRRQPSRMRRKLPLDGNIREFLQDNFPPIQVKNDAPPLWARAEHRNGRAVILVNETLVKAVDDTHNPSTDLVFMLIVLHQLAHLLMENLLGESIDCSMEDLNFDKELFGAPLSLAATTASTGLQLHVVLGSTGHTIDKRRCEGVLKAFREERIQIDLSSNRRPRNSPTTPHSTSLVSTCDVTKKSGAAISGAGLLDLGRLPSRGVSSLAEELSGPPSSNLRSKRQQQRQQLKPFLAEYIFQPPNRERGRIKETKGTKGTRPRKKKRGVKA